MVDIVQDGIDFDRANPARVYVSYGTNDLFPYGGQPYGHPYDRWTWSALSGPDERLYRYYYPPVR